MVYKVTTPNPFIFVDDLDLPFNETIQRSYGYMLNMIWDVYMYKVDRLKNMTRVCVNYYGLLIYSRFIQNYLVLKVDFL